MFSYRSTLKKAFEVIWNHKYLWFFGLFATFLANGSHFRLAFGRIDQALFKESFLLNFGRIFDPVIFVNFGNAFKHDPMAAFSALVFLLILLVLFSFFVWLVVVSEIGLINNSATIIKKNKKTTLKEGVEAGISNFWPVFGIGLIGRAFVCFLLLFISLPLVFMDYGSGPAFNTLYILLFLAFLPVALIVSFMVKYASAYVILRGKKFIEAIEASWSLFLKNWLVSIEAAFIILFIQLIASLGVFLAVLVLAIPYLFIAYILTSLLSSLIIPAVTFTLMISIGIVLAVFLVVILGAALTSFRTVAWTNIFLELDSKHPTLSKLIRWFG